MFYEFNQNNSGGSFHVDENVAHRVLIEADSEREATDKALDIGIYFNGVEEGRDCECCGDRWYGCDEVELKKDETIEEYAQKQANRWGWTSPDCIIHYADGTKTNVYIEKKKK